MDERQQQLIEQCKAVAHMANALASVYADKAKLYASKPMEGQFVNMVGHFSAEHMECLGDILNGMDAGDDKEDDWLAPIFERAQEMFPALKTSNRT